MNSPQTLGVALLACNLAARTRSRTKYALARTAKGLRRPVELATNYPGATSVRCRFALGSLALGDPWRAALATRAQNKQAQASYRQRRHGSDEPHFWNWR